MDINTFIDNKLDQYREYSEGSLKSVDDNFVFAYGPFMCMQTGVYERECDEIAKYNKYMQLMVHVSYLIRKIKSNVSYSDLKRNIMKDFIISIDNAFSEYDKDIKEALRQFASNYLNKIRDEQKSKGDLESFMTNSSPIVPYDQMVRRPDLESAEETLHADIVGSAKQYIGVNIKETLINLLLKNLAEIMMNTSLTTVLFDDKYNIDKVNLINLDNLTKRNDSVSPECQRYYFLAIVNYYGLQDNVAFDRYMNFFEEAGDFTKTKNFATFESMIDTMASSTNIDIAAESWDDPSLDAKEEEAISQIIQSHTSYIEDNTTEVKYDFGILNDFINVKRYMKFEEYPNRLFLGSLEKTRVININNMGMDRNYYEMDNNTVACPFLDLRTYQVRVIVLHANTNDIEIIDDIKETY